MNTLGVVKGKGIGADRESGSISGEQNKAPSKGM